MFSYTILGKVLCANSFTPVAAAYLASAVFSGLVPLLLLHRVQEPSTQHLHSLGFVLVLRLFVLAADNETRG